MKKSQEQVSKKRYVPRGGIDRIINAAAAIVTSCYVGYLMFVFMLTLVFYGGVVQAMPLAGAGFVISMLVIWLSVDRAQKINHPVLRVAAVAVACLLTVFACERLTGMGDLFPKRSTAQLQLNKIVLRNESFKKLTPGAKGGMRFLFSYTLVFPVDIDPRLSVSIGYNRGEYANKTRAHVQDDFRFTAGIPYAFTMVFDTENTFVDFAKDKVEIQIRWEGSARTIAVATPFTGTVGPKPSDLGILLRPLMRE